MNNPNATANADTTRWDFKVSGTYEAAYGIRISPLVRHQAGQTSRSRLRGFFDLFNITNSNAVQVRTVATGTSFLRPTAIRSPRTARLGARLSF